MNIELIFEEDIQDLNLSISIRKGGKVSVDTAKPSIMKETEEPVVKKTTTKKKPSVAKEEKKDTNPAPGNFMDYFNNE